MREIEAALVMIALFALRCVVPLLVTLGLCYLMNRLVDRWEAEENVSAASGGQQPAAVEWEEPPGTLIPALSVPCWLVRNCEPERRARCPAYLQPELPCWQARLQAENALPEACLSCDRFLSAPTAVGTLHPHQERDSPRRVSLRPLNLPTQSGPS
jgi:hypothetical protein